MLSVEKKGENSLYSAASIVTSFTLLEIVCKQVVVDIKICVHTVTTIA